MTCTCCPVHNTRSEKKKCCDKCVGYESKGVDSWTYCQVNYKGCCHFDTPPSEEKKCLVCYSCHNGLPCHQPPFPTQEEKKCCRRCSDESDNPAPLLCENCLCHKPGDTEYRTVGHVFRGSFAGEKGEDKCLEMFGEEDEECREYNKNLLSPTPPDAWEEEYDRKFGHIRYRGSPASAIKSFIRTKKKEFEREAVEAYKRQHEG